jgi:cell division protein FtsI/penicillin-binding protein 2
VLSLVANLNYGTNAAAGQTLTNLPASTSDPFGAGSTFKITTTAAGLENGVIGFNSNLPNPKSACYNFHIRGQSCYPVSNPETNNVDPLPLPEALAISPNTAFVNLELETGLGNVLNMGYRLGLRNSLEHDTLGRPVTDPKNSQMSYFQNYPSYTLGTVALSRLSWPTSWRPWAAAACGARQRRSCRSPTGTGSRSRSSSRRVNASYPPPWRTRNSAA